MRPPACSARRCVPCCPVNFETCSTNPAAPLLACLGTLALGSIADTDHGAIAMRLAGLCSRAPAHPRQPQPLCLVDAKLMAERVMKDMGVARPWESSIMLHAICTASTTAVESNAKWRWVHGDTFVPLHVPHGTIGCTELTRPASISTPSSPNSLSPAALGWLYGALPHAAGLPASEAAAWAAIAAAWSLMAGRPCTTLVSAWMYELTGMALKRRKCGRREAARVLKNHSQTVQTSR